MFARYCSAKERPYGRLGSYSIPPAYQPAERLLSVQAVNARRQELVTLGPSDTPALAYEYLYVVLLQGGRWVVDSRKSRPLGLAAWQRATL